jgi:hypothetical protein
MRDWKLVAGVFFGSMLFFKFFLVAGSSSTQQSGQQPQEPPAQTSKPKVAPLARCEDRERDEDRMIRAATGKDPELIRRVLAEAPMAIARGDGTPDELRQLSKLTDEWSVILAKWRLEHPCL